MEKTMFSEMVCWNPTQQPALKLGSHQYNEVVYECKSNIQKKKKRLAQKQNIRVSCTHKSTIWDGF